MSSPAQQPRVDTIGAPEGWTITSQISPDGELDLSYVSRTGKLLRNVGEVHHHLKYDLGEAACNEDEALWLTTLDRYGRGYRHWALAKSAHTLPECPVFRPSAEEFSEPGEYIESIMPLMAQYGICKVVPPAGWKPTPWSGTPPEGLDGQEELRGDDMEKLCGEIIGGGKKDVRLAPRVQPLQLFNISFEQCPAVLTASEYKLLMELTFPSAAQADPTCKEAEQQFWNLMATRPLHNSVKPDGEEAMQLRLEARTYQEEVQSLQTETYGRPMRRGSGYSATVLPFLPWELEGAPP
eukprot:CAMPEP_0113267698 /NCGR_PEP_ID=MMETSP0008_2-20120614/20749_1 /TAXON_ID=97485 /ORGANISM="Prymnesium parvum" /LENGTH=294 /DNA_ID=CAMNT_0000116751 /DNA_START=167 /DNA_END=1048 /DNA_ORIENTATION=- /assembly_acc=CAM_ASM_000153